MYDRACMNLISTVAAQRTYLDGQQRYGHDKQHEGEDDPAWICLGDGEGGCAGRDDEERGA